MYRPGHHVRIRTKTKEGLDRKKLGFKYMNWCMNYGHYRENIYAMAEINIKISGRILIGSGAINIYGHVPRSK